MRAGVETRPYNVILRLQTEESPSDCKIFAGDIHECPTGEGNPSPTLFVYYKAAIYLLILALISSVPRIAMME